MANVNHAHKIGIIIRKSLRAFKSGNKNVWQWLSLAKVFSFSSALIEDTWSDHRPLVAWSVDLFWAENTRTNGLWKVNFRHARTLTHACMHLVSDNPHKYYGATGPAHALRWYDHDRHKIKFFKSSSFTFGCWLLWIWKRVKQNPFVGCNRTTGCNLAD